MFSQLFDPTYCNQLLDEMAEAFPHSMYGPQHQAMEMTPHAARILSKKLIQLLQINLALDEVIQSPHLEECFQRLSILQAPYIEDESFLNEMHSFFTSDYGTDVARNYAIGLKQYVEFIRHSVYDFTLLNQEIFGTDVHQWKVAQVDAFVKTTQRKIKAFMKTKQMLFLNVFHRFEVYVEKNKFHKLVAILESE
jgi:hypothetical protein